MNFRNLLTMLPVRWPRRFTYALAGLLFALGLPAGLLTIHAAFDKHLEHRLSEAMPTATWIVRELGSRPLTYGYLLFSGATLMVLVGWMVGRREDQLQELSVTDPLTGLANRRRLVAEIGEEIKRTARYGTPLALLLLDVDHLKELNDESGHAAGDRALQLVAESVRQSCRATDIAARVGGDEFAVMAANTSAAEALALAQRIRANLRRPRPPAPLGMAGAGLADASDASGAAGGVSHAPSPADAAAPRLPTPPTPSLSIGIADLDRAPAPTLEALQVAADQALYRAKAEGRDRVVLAPARTRRLSSLWLDPPPGGHARA